MSVKGSSQTGSSGQPPTTASRVTRSHTKPTVSVPPNAKGLSPIAKKNKPATAGEEARQVLADKKCIDTDEKATPIALFKIFKRILERYDNAIPEDLHLTLQAYAILLQEGASSQQLTNKAIEAVASRVEERMESAIERNMNTLSNMVESIAAKQKEMQNTTSTLSGTAEAFQKLASEMDSNVKEATAMSNQLTSTVTTYKDALLGNNTPKAHESMQAQGNNHVDPRLTRDLDRKQRQILIEVSKDYTEGKSATEIKERIDEALSSVTPPPPEGAKVQEINKLRNGGIIIQLMTKEAAEWLHDSTNELSFTSKLEANAFIRDREFPILVPRVPLTFDPANQDHLREAECMNNLPPKSISKARWIKPEYRRHPKQKYAYATISLKSACEANRLIRDGMSICSTRTFPKRLKYEPKQCMKCRKWGHYASECRSEKDVCGTCGGDHTTRDCDEAGRRYCVSCRTEDHASWDRTCPEFIRKSAHFDELHPENALTYFPTDEEWTHSIRPERIPIESRFPERYAVGGLPPLDYTAYAPKQRYNKTADRRSKRRGTGKEAGLQGTLDNYVATQPTERRTRFADKVTILNEQDDEKDEREADSLIQAALWSE